VPCAVAWRTHARSTAAAALVALLLLALVIAIISATWITPAIEDLRIAGQSASPEFRRLHYVSIIAYLLELTGLLIAGSLIPATFTRRSDPLLKGCI
jgi:hypothetical protein